VTTAGAPDPRRRDFSSPIVLYRALGAAVAIAGMEVFGTAIAEPLFRVPFVTSIVLVMALPNSEPARWTSVLGGHLVSCVAGYAALWVLGAGSTAASVGVGLATLAMISGRCLHPPAGINAFLIPQNGLPLVWAASPVAVGALLLIGYAWLWRAGETRVEDWVGRKV
jgi:CBS-domain-containing membrane protein